MIIREINNKETILFEAEESREFKFLESFPGLLREDKYFYSPCKPRVIYNLYTRISKYIRPVHIKYTPFIKDVLNNSFPLLDLPSSFNFHTKPLLHQIQALRFMYTQGSCGLLLDPGLGKTKVILDYIHLMEFNKVVIVCPKPLLYVWEEEVIKHRPEVRCYVIKSTNWDAEKEQIEASQMVVINYNKAVTLEDNLVKLNPEFLALDEGLIKNYTTDRTKSLTKLGKKIPYKCVMSGTLINNSPLDCFAPLRFVEPAIVGEGVTRFKDRYAITARQNRNIVLGFRDMPEIQSILSSSCIVMRKEEWLKDLPPKKFHIVKSQLDGEALECYNSLVSNWMFEIGNECFEYDNPLPRLGKLLQIANGFVYSSEAEEDTLEEVLEEPKAKKKKQVKRKTILFNHQPKIDSLKDLINDPARLGNRRSIIWFNFQAELEILETFLKTQGIKYVTVKGGDKDIGKTINLFNNDPSYRFLLGQAKTINYGATILGRNDEEDYEITPEFSTTVSDQIFYSLNFSLEVFLQQQDRIHRIGQTKECNYWILLTNSCIEAKVYKTMEDKIFINKSLLVDFSKDISMLK